MFIAGVRPLVTMEEIMALAYGVRTVRQYEAISNSLFRNESDIKHVFVWEMFTFFYSFKNQNQPQITTAYKKMWWNLFLTFSVKTKFRLVFWWVYRIFFQLEWSEFAKARSAGRPKDRATNV